MKAFNDGIRNMIKKFDYEFNIVRQDFNNPCACVDFVTKQPDPACKKCLGTGYRVTIRKIRGASQDSHGSFKNNSTEERISASSYYIDGKYDISTENIIIDAGVPLVSHRVEVKRTANREIVYRKVYAVMKKGNPQLFMENYNRALKGDRR